jgi:phospholipase/lecithinase/hemolysin
MGKLSQTFVVIAVGMALNMLPACASAQFAFRDLFVFGDSLSDTGNIFRLTLENVPESPPYFRGRFSNGPVWVEGLADRLALEVEPSLQGGTNFAFGGAETGLEDNDLFERNIGALIPSLRAQVHTFLLSDFIGDPLAGFDNADPEALYIVWGGPNDLRQAVIQMTTEPATEAQTAVDDLVEAIRNLAEAGARSFLVPNLPNLGLTPESRALGPEAMALATEISVLFNNALAKALEALEAEFDITIFRLDTFTLLEEVVADPAAFGFTNVTEPCLAGDPFEGGTPCMSPDVFLFWDEIHPTAAAHAILANFALAAIGPPLIVVPGEQNSEATIEVSPPVQDLAVLHVRLSTGGEMVNLSGVRVAFTDQEGDAALVETLRARLIDDANGNGQFDAGETVLATREAAGVVDTLDLEVIPPLELLPDTSVQLLVTLDLSPDTGMASTAGVTPPPRHGTVMRLGRLGMLMPVLGVAFLLGWCRRSPRSPWRLLILMACCSVMLMGCPDLFKSNDDGFTFTVVLPEAGVTAQGSMSGPLAVPASAIDGRTVTILP